MCTVIYYVSDATPLFNPIVFLVSHIYLWSLGLVSVQFPFYYPCVMFPIFERGSLIRSFYVKPLV